MELGGHLAELIDIRLEETHQPVAASRLSRRLASPCRRRGRFIFGEKEPLRSAERSGPGNENEMRVKYAVFLSSAASASIAWRLRC